MAFKRILLALDGSSEAEAAVKHAAELARVFGARLFLAQVLSGSDEQAGRECFDWQMRKIQARRYLEGIAALPELTGIEVAVELSEGRPAEGILNACDELDIDLIVVSAIGATGPSRFGMGGTAHKLLVATEIAVVVARPPLRATPGAAIYQRILVPLDGSYPSETGFRVATAIAGDSGCEIILLHVVSAPDMPRRAGLSDSERELSDKVVDANRLAAFEYLASLERQFGERHAIRTRLETCDDPAGRLGQVAAEESADLVIVTRHTASRSGASAQDRLTRLALSGSPHSVMVLRHHPGSV